MRSDVLDESESISDATSCTTKESEYVSPHAGDVIHSAGEFGPSVGAA